MTIRWPRCPTTEFSRQQNPAAAVIAGIEVADAAQIGLAAASMVQSQVAATQGAFTLSFDKAERLLTTEARQSMPGAAKAGKSKYERLVLHIPNAASDDRERRHRRALGGQRRTARSVR